MAVLGVAGVLVVPQLYASWANSKAEKAPELEDSGKSESFKASDLEGAWKVGGGGSFAGYRVKEVLRGENVTVTGRSKSVTGSLNVDGGTLREARFSVDVADIKTPEATRDVYFRKNAMETDKFPKAGFKVTKPVDVGALADGRTHNVKLKGDLTVHGVQRPVSFTAKTQAGPNKTKIVGSIPITFQDFGVKAPSLGFVKVENQGSVEFSLAAEPS
ncbi:YceI family protein [Streptomyces bathyalis]|uniref:YceI family protein n=1 Tax=Streptomyces bathyalis TaxID=2710756 RepID=A0A7T1TCY4_9ACTN|nr:YceI family protein [Streptomyces bathyalis]